MLHFVFYFLKQIIRSMEDIDSKFASFLDVKIELEVLFASALRKFPDCQALIEKKNFFDSIFNNNAFKDITAGVGSCTEKAGQGDPVNVEQEHVDIMDENFFFVLIVE